MWKLRSWIFIAALAFASSLVGCGKKEAAADSTPPATGTATVQPAATEVKQELSSVQQALKSGSYDNAAAELLRMRAAGRNFSQQDAAAYREALSEAYSRALEAAAKGDAKAAAAVQMIRASGGR